MSWRSVLRDRFLLFPLLTPAVLLAAGNDGFGFDGPGLVDSFIYLGNFWHYLEHLPRFDNDYKISRLPWVLPGFAAHALGGEIAGAFVLDYLTMAAGAVALYLLVRDAVNDRAAAAVIAVAWACCTPGHGVGGWNYHMLATGAYYLAACWFVLRAARGPSRRHAAFLAGVLLACAVHTHLFLVAYFPLVALLYWSALPPARGRSLAQAVRHLILLVIGALAVTALLMAVNGVTGGKWVFFENQINFTLREWGSDAYPLWVGDPLLWIPTAMHLVIPVLFMTAGLGHLGRSTAQPSSRLRVSFVVQAWAAFAILCFFQFVRRVPMLDHYYFAFVAYFCAFPCAAAALAGHEAIDGRRDRLLLVAIAALIMIGSLLLLPTVLPSVLGAWAAIGPARLPQVALPLIVGTLGIVVMIGLSGPGRLVAFALWFSVVNVLIAPEPTDYGIGTPGSQRQMVVLFREADRFTADLDPTLSGIKYWFVDESVLTPHGAVPLNYAFDSFVATRGWMANLFGGESPLLPVERLTVEHLETTACLGLLSSEARHDELTRGLSRHFEQLGRPLGVVASRLFARDSISFALTVFKPLSATETLPPCWPI
jgi:hypothetical protein